MNHFEVNLKVSRVSDSKVLRMTIQFEYFSDIKANGLCNVGNFRWFLCSRPMSPDVPANKAYIFTRDFKF